ncbi:hypothetical protein GCM10022245_30710 [Streptomyces mayteni]
MGSCPLCGGRREADAESGWMLCFGCGQLFAPSPERRCPGLEQWRDRALQRPYEPRRHT